MSLFPSRRLLRLVAGWLAAAVIASAWPPLLAPLTIALLVLLLVVVRDGYLLTRRPRPAVERIVPSRAVIDRKDEIVLRLTNPADVPASLELEDEWPRSSWRTSGRST